MPEWTEGDVEVSDGRLHIYRMGAGRPVVLAHGATDDGRCWSRLATALADDYELIAFDARGHGRSSEPVGGVPAGDDIVALVRALDLGRPAAVGHSMGASALCQALQGQPELFAAAILEDPGWGLEPSIESDASGQLLRLLTGWVASLRGLSLPEVIAIGRAQNPSWDEQDLSDWAAAKLEFRGIASGAPGRSDWREQVRAFACPVLLVCGTPGQALVSPDTAAEAVRLNPLVEVASLSAGHNIRREAFEDFTRTTRRFLAAHLR